MMLQFSSLLFSGLWLATFLPHFPNTPFTLTHVSTARRRVRYYGDSDSYQRSHHWQVSPLVSYYLPVVPSSTTWYATSPLYSPPQRDVLFPGFAALVQAHRNTPPKQVRHPTDRQFASGYSPTSSRDDAVAFGYGAVANSGRDLHPANSTPSR